MYTPPCPRLDARVENKAKHWHAAITTVGAVGDVPSVCPASLSFRLSLVSPVSFSGQIDVVLPAWIARDHTFSSLNTAYSTAQFTLSELYEHASRLAIPDVSVPRPIPAHCTLHLETESWFADQAIQSRPHPARRRRHVVHRPAWRPHALRLEKSLRAARAGRHEAPVQGAS